MTLDHNHIFLFSSSNNSDSFAPFLLTWSPKSQEFSLPHKCILKNALEVLPQHIYHLVQFVGKDGEEGESRSLYAFGWPDILTFMCTKYFALCSSLGLKKLILLCKYLYPVAWCIAWCPALPCNLSLSLFWPKWSSEGIMFQRESLVWINYQLDFSSIKTIYR